ncbi:hypothetical protein [Polaromonas sp.]|uniref:hypothetical protein n=1 Tax=Polaromonas sp. TaxID=1869339 RepID=UPI0017F045D3|nr:hypothetical protein [Polaromonas sp.]NMM05404.1 hypothetical protein [Polaromonas sp.]
MAAVFADALWLLLAALGEAIARLPLVARAGPIAQGVARQRPAWFLGFTLK